MACIFLGVITYLYEQLFTFPRNITSVMGLQISFHKSFQTLVARLQAQAKFLQKRCIVHKICSEIIANGFYNRALQFNAILMLP